MVPAAKESRPIYFFFFFLEEILSIVFCQRTESSRPIPQWVWGYVLWGGLNKCLPIQLLNLISSSPGLWGRRDKNQSVGFLDFLSRKWKCSLSYGRLITSHFCGYVLENKFLVDLIPCKIFDIIFPVKILKTWSYSLLVIFYHLVVRSAYVSLRKYL